VKKIKNDSVIVYVEMSVTGIKIGDLTTVYSFLDSMQLHSH